MKNFKIISIGLAVSAAALLLLLQKCNKNEIKQLKKEAKRAYINPAFPFLEIPQRVEMLDPSKANDLMSPYGKIEIPENAFLDKDGNIVKGKVKFGVRYTMDPIATMIAGVPMETAEESGNYLESAGMMEITAETKKGEPLYVNPDSKIKVTINTAFPGEDYNIYSLDTANRQWTEYGSNLTAEPIKREVESSTQTPAIKEPNYDALAQAEGLVNPVKPVEKNKKLYQFKFKTDFSKYPELNIYNGVQWEFTGNKDKENPAKNPWVTSAVWNEMEIVKRKKNGIYKLRLVSGDKVFETTVKPVFDAQDIEYAEYVFNQTYDKYRTFVDKKKEEARQWRLKQEQLARERAQREKVYELTGKFSRQFEVVQFGWCNIDRIMQYDGQKIMASFIDKTGKRLPVDRVYLVIDSVNSVQTYYKDGLDKFTFARKGGNHMVIIDSLANAYALGSNEFERVNSVSKKHQFKVGDPENIKSEADIRKLLKTM